jgi:hypothetical protein
MDGISSIHLVDQLPPEPNSLPKSAKEAAAQGLSLYGWYSRQYKKRPASISLHIPDILRGVPSIYWLTSAPTVLITLTLAHEMGHHLVAKRGHIFQKGESYKRRYDVEKLCDSYAYSAVARMRQNWYYRFGQWAIKDLADTHYIQAVLDWKNKNYKEAAERCYKAWTLNPEHRDANYWYWRAKEMCESESVGRA